MFKPLIYVFLPFVPLLRTVWKNKLFLLPIMPAYWSRRKYIEDFPYSGGSCHPYYIWSSVGVWGLSFFMGSILFALVCMGTGFSPEFWLSWTIKVLLMMAPMVLLSALYESGRIIAKEQEAEKAKAPPAISPAETNKENGMNPTETKVDDPTVSNVARNAYEHEISGLRKALDEDEGRIKFWKWLAIGVLSVVVLAGVATGYMLHKGILVVEVDGVSLAQELEKAQSELERLQGELPALEDAKKKLDEMMEKAKEMVPPGILPEKPDKGDDF